MRSYGKVLAVVGALALWPAVAAQGEGQQAAATLRVLLLSGANNHDWKTTTPALKKILEDSGRFTVDVAEDPAKCEAGTFGAYDVIVSDWTSWPDTKKRIWPEAVEKAFLDFVRDGKGLAVFHAASTAFQTWPEYQQMVGSTWALGTTGHGRIHAFKVSITDRNHPITRGMADFMIRDELWHRTGKQADLHVLCKAFSSKDSGGSGDSEPVALWTKFGRGRCFNLVLGHDAEAMSHAGWRTLMTRGVEWAATGKVTLPVLAAGAVAAPAVAAEVDLGADLASIARYQFGQKRTVLLRFEKAALAASTQPSARSELRKKLVASLGGDASVDGKAFFIHQLGLIGTAEDVPVLAGLLADKDLSLAARSALQWMPGDEAVAALGQALAGSQGLVRAGLINTLGERRDAGSLEAVSACLADADPVVVGAAIDALGKIGGSAAVKALAGVPATVPPDVLARRSDALLRCAEGLAAGGGGAEAEAIYAGLSGPGNPRYVRLAAFPRLIAGNREKADELLLSALSGDDAVLRAAAMRCVRPPGKDRIAGEKMQVLSKALNSVQSPEAKRDLVAQLRTVLTPEAMQMALGFLKDAGLAELAGQTVVHIAAISQELPPAEVASALRAVLSACKSPVTRGQAMVLLLRLDKPVNLALGATATSPDDLEKDGASHGDPAAIDGKPDTYWDEADNQKLYVLKVTFKQPTDVSAIDIVGHQHHSYAPKDFEIVCDDKVVKKVENAIYLDNELVVPFERTRCTSLELRITGYYGQSPAIRELRIYDTSALLQ
jgi:uncharacterized protein